MLADYPVIPLYFHSVVANRLNHIRSQALATNTGTFMRSRTNTKRAAAASVEQFGIARGTMRAMGQAMPSDSPAARLRPRAAPYV
jgi:hypothetical protein